MNRQQKIGAKLSFMAARFGKMMHYGIFSLSGVHSFI